MQNYRGFTIGIKDVTANQKAVVDRQPHLDRRPAQSMADIVTHFKLGKVPKKANKVAKMLKGAANKSVMLKSQHWQFDLSFSRELGAMGSRDNLLNMTSALSQVELDGKRAPLMISGRSLPCYKPYEYDGRAGVLAPGIETQEYFFHCIAGRSVDCKTLVAYDITVRDHDNSVVQFDYGEDGIDVAKTPYLKPYQVEFIAANYNHYVDRSRS